MGQKADFVVDKKEKHVSTDVIFFTSRCIISYCLALEERLDSKNFKTFQTTDPNYKYIKNHLEIHGKINFEIYGLKHVLKYSESIPTKKNFRFSV